MPDQSVATTAPIPSISAINPKNGSKYSPNLYNWLRKKARDNKSFVSRLQIYRCEERSLLWIGTLSDDGKWLHGANLIGVLCSGGKEEIWAFCVKTHMIRLALISGFWQRYQAIGRCAIDVDHTMDFTEDESRWKQDGDVRHCLWCGQVTQRLHRWTETVERKAWKNE